MALSGLMQNSLLLLELILSFNVKYYEMINFNHLFLKEWVYVTYHQKPEMVNALSIQMRVFRFLSAQPRTNIKPIQIRLLLGVLPNCT